MKSIPVHISNRKQTPLYFQKNFWHVFFLTDSLI